MTLIESRPAITAGSCALSSRARLRADVEDREATVLRVVERAAREEIARLVEIREVRHVSVLERFRSLVLELRRVGPEDRQHDRELVEFHGSS